MLSRIAESLYWVGRYVERAEDSARLLDVQYHLLVEERRPNEVDICRALLAVMGVDPGTLGAAPTAAAVTELLAGDPSYSGSITACIGAAWENARGARESLSSEIWETLNATHQQLPGRFRNSTGSARHELFQWIKDRAAAVTGLVDATLSRDDGWRFLVLGRSLERADMTARLLAACDEQTWGLTAWTTALRCCSALEAFLRTYRRPVDGPTAVEFLLLDRLFPRSVYHVLGGAERRLAELDPGAGRGGDRVGVDDEARRLLGRVCAQFEFLRVEEALRDLPRLLGKLQADCAEVHAAVARRYFRETRIIEWSV